jgi:uncharacterized Fe-S cluster protein YjdI
VREYEGDGIVVEWRPELCYHSEKCVAALPNVFSKDRRPWIDATAAPADEVRRAVEGCPSGALRLRAEHEHVGEVEIRPSPDGPLLVRGPIRVIGADGTVQELEKAAFCRCGQSKNKPFCDGTHKEVGFLA